MYRVKLLIFYVSILFVSACKQEVIESKTETKTSSYDNELRDWQFKDLEQDSLPGISLDRTYKELINENDGVSVIVGLLDDGVDIHHPDLMNQIYINTEEIAGNNLDDDNNGYIDDVNGWNFLGYDNDKVIMDGVYPHITIINNFKNNLDEDTSDSTSYALYERASKLFGEKEIASTSGIVRGREIFESYAWLKSNYGHLFSSDDYPEQLFDSIIPKNEKEKQFLKTVKTFSGIGFIGIEYMESQPWASYKDKYIYNNLKNNSWSKVDDKPNNLDDQSYGIPIVNARADYFSHGTQTAGIIAAERNNGFGIRGVSNNIKIMPLPIITNPSNRDKDFINAIRYAVDNGAKVINFSFSKAILEHEKEVFEALKYAENNDVLIITSAGNGRANNDLPENVNYPKKTSIFSSDTLTNLIKVGATGKDLDENIVAPFSNYGKIDVDIFCPGRRMKVTNATTMYIENRSGTSLSSALTAGVAAMIRSHFPELSAKEVRKILLDSGTSFDFTVKTGDGNRIPFNELSESGKLLNAFNAVKMAQSISSNKE